MTPSYIFTMNFAYTPSTIKLSILIFAYVAAQAYSIYSLVPRTTSHKAKANENGGELGCLQSIKSILNCIVTSEIYKFYRDFRNPFIPIGLQIFETTSQMVSFGVYVSSIPTRFASILQLLWFASLVICLNFRYVNFRSPYVSDT